MLTAFGDSRICFGLAAVAVGTVVLLARPVAADPPPGKPPEQPPPATATAPPESSPGSIPVPSVKLLGSKPSTDLQFLPGPNGELVPVPVGASLRDYLNWLQTRGQNGAVQPPEFGVISVELDGEADGDHVRMRGRVRVQINRKDGWIRVPLRFDEAVFQEIGHTGPGDMLHERDEATTGHDWWMQGAGVHELTLTGTVSIRRQGQEQRLQLQLPSSVIATLKLRVPHPNAVAKVPEKVIVRSRRADDQATGRVLTEFDVSGFGSRLDFTWEALSAATSNEAVLEVGSSIFASVVDGETITQEVTQRIQALQGNLDELRVRLPAGYELLRLDAAEAAGHRVDPTDPSLVIVKLKRLTAGPVELRWTVRSKSPAPESQFVLDGFEVDRARIQTGQIAVGLVGDFRLSKKTNDDRFVQRINPSDLPPTMRRNDVASAYRILNQPFRLSLAVEKVEPLVSVEPWHFLSLSDNQAEMESAYLLNIRRGGVSELVLHWTGESADGWSVIRVDPPARVEPINNFDDSGTASRLVRLRFVEPLRGTTEVRIQTRKPIANEPTDATWPLALPALDTAYHSPATLLISGGGSRDVIVEGSGVASAAEIADLETLRVTAPLNWVGGSAQSIKLAAESHDVALRFAETQTGLASQDGETGSHKHRNRIPAGVSISRSWIRTQATTGAGALSVERHRVLGPLTRLSIRFDKEVSDGRVWWDGRQLQPIRETGDDTTYRILEYRLDHRPAADSAKSHLKSSGRESRSRNESDEHLLQIEYEISGFGLGRVVEHNRMVRPRIDPDLPVRETIWEVVLPSHRHLFSEPESLTPLYSWQRQSWFWSRTSPVAEDDLVRWVQTTDDASPIHPAAVGNRYLFTQVGGDVSSLRTVEFSSMSQSEIVLFGAGLALFLGLMLIKVSVTRNVLTVLLIAFAVAALGLWQTSPILVLLQPAGLGVLLAVSAALLDGWVKRRRNSRGLTISSPSGFVSPPSSIERQLAIGVGSNDFTSVRPEPATIDQPLTASEAGMRP
ncbi:MAG: hypothetical protein HZA46_05055 [Planctomycetales bacterium]|nr:hypothetical protein [Planctomycetales bacterium]